MRSYSQVKAILQNNRDRELEPESAPQLGLPLRENVRGGGYYH